MTPREHVDRYFDTVVGKDARSDLVGRAALYELAKEVAADAVAEVARERDWLALVLYDIEAAVKEYVDDGYHGFHLDEIGILARAAIRRLEARAAVNGTKARPSVVGEPATWGCTCRVDARDNITEVDASCTVHRSKETP